MSLHLHPIKSTCAVIAGVVGGWTLSGVLSTIASALAIVVASLQIYDWVQRKRGKRSDK
jgi:predicted PurR-regulated permease PerM